MPLHHFDQFSIGTIVQVILLAGITGYFLSLKNKSKPTWLITLFFAGLTVGFASLAMVYTLVTTLWLLFIEGLWIFLLLAFTAILQLPYIYPHPERKVEARLVLIISALFALGTASGAVYIALVPANYSQSHTLPAIIFLGMEIAWFIFTMLRRTVEVSRKATGSAGSWLQIIANSNQREARMLRGFALTMFMPVAILLAQIAFIWGLIPPALVSYFYQLVMMIFLLTLAFVYVNHAPEPTTFLIKIVGVSFVFVMTVVTALLTIVLPAYEESYNKIRKLEIQLVEERLSANEFDRMPPDIRYVLALPAPADFERPQYSLLYAHDSDFTFNSPWFSADSLVAATSTQFSTLFTNLKLGERYNRTTDQTEATTRYTVYFFQDGDTVYEVGYDYADFVHETQPDGYTILILIIGASLFLVFGFRLFLHPSLIAPLDKLVDGMKRVNENDLNIEIPIHAADEIGFLTGSFNEMVRSLRDAAIFKESYHRELEEKVIERTSQLEEARDAANAASRAKSSFLASMSHEIRTPMNAVMGMSSLLLNTQLNNEQREFADTIRSSSNSLLTIINDILDFSKIESGKLELESQSFELRECLESAIDLLALNAAEKGLELGCVIEPDAPVLINGDETRLRQIVVNLLGNAIKFTNTGEVVLSVDVARDQVLPESLKTVLHFSIRDTGIGIPQNRLNQLFQSFSQVDSSATRKYGGTGLGLVISKRLSELMGGSMWVESVEGVGSTFHFTIQVQADAMPRAEKPAAAPQLSGKRILIVDDNQTNRRILSLQTQSWNMIPFVFSDPLEALNHIKNGELYDLAILDMHMPQMDGLTLAKEIRKNDNPLPLIMLTSLGWRDPGDTINFSAFLTKPVKQSGLYNALVSILSLQDGEVITASPAEPTFDSTFAERHPMKILLAEDNAVNQKLAIRILDRMGYRVDVAANGLEALASIERQSYDLILMDIQMPEMDGLEATRIIRKKVPQNQQPRIVAMTANAMQGDREMCLAAGMDDYVSKPIQIKDLVAALENIAGK